MPVELTIVESVTELNTTVTTVVLESASAPGPAGADGVGVPAGGTTGQVLAKASNTDFDTEWATGGSGADDQTAAEVPFTPAGNLAATDVQAALQELDSEKAAASHAHAGEDITSGTVADARIAATIARDSEVTAAISASEAGQVRDGDAAGGVLSGTYPNPGFASDMATQAELDAHINDATAAHAASAVSVDSTTLVGTGTDAQAVFEELDNAVADHLADTSDAHDASAISVADAGGYYTGTDVEAVLAEIAPLWRFSGAKVGKTGNQTISNNTTTALTWNQEDWDTDSYHDTGSNTERLEIPASGKYAVSAAVGFVADADGIRRVTFYKNGIAGTLLYRTDITVVSGAANTFICAYTEVDLVDTDYVVIAVLHTANNDLDVLSAQTNATIRRIG